MHSGVGHTWGGWGVLRVGGVYSGVGGVHSGWGALGSGVQSISTSKSDDLF